MERLPIYTEFGEELLKLIFNIFSSSVTHYDNEISRIAQRSKHCYRYNFNFDLNSIQFFDGYTVVIKQHQYTVTDQIMSKLSTDHFNQISYLLELCCELVKKLPSPKDGIFDIECLHRNKFLKINLKSVPTYLRQIPVEYFHLLYDYFSNEFNINAISNKYGRSTVEKIIGKQPPKNVLSLIEELDTKVNNILYKFIDKTNSIKRSINEKKNAVILDLQNENFKLSEKFEISINEIREKQNELRKDAQ